MYSARQLRDILHISHSTYIGYIGANRLICTYPTSIRGAGHRYTEEDMIRNILFMELTACGLKQEPAYKIISTADVHEPLIKHTVGTSSTLIVHMIPLREKLEIYNKQMEAPNE